MSDLFARAAELAARREPFATATIVRAERPTSAKPGARAIVTAAGRLEGWIGGNCAAPVVIRESLQALADGEPRLISLASGPAGSRDGVRHFPMTCHSGGTLEIFIEPMLPSEQIVIVGRAPVARALAAQGAALGRHVVVVDPDAHPKDFPHALVARDLASVAVNERAAVVVATRGESDEDAVRDALATPARYVALVASRARGSILVEALAEAGVARASLERLRYPAGLDIGARSEEEIALSILAEILSLRPRAGQATGAAPAEAIDPICGMTVALTADALRADHAGTTYYFCAPGCRRRFLKDPAAALATT